MLELFCPFRSLEEIFFFLFSVLVCCLQQYPCLWPTKEHTSTTIFLSRPNTMTQAAITSVMSNEHHISFGLQPLKSHKYRP